MEALEAAQVHLRDRDAVAGDADEAHQPLVPGLDRRLEGAAGSQRDLPLDHVDQVVQLDQIDVVDAEALQRAPDLVARARRCARRSWSRGRTGRGCVAARRRAQLRVAVAGGDVDVVDAELQQCLQRRIRLGL